MEMQLTPVTNHPVFMNKQLEKVTQAIIDCGNTIQSRRYAVAALLAKVEVEKLYEDDGFTSAAEYAKATFGMEKTLAYNLIKIGTDYTRPIIDAKGKTKGYCSNLLPSANPDAQDAPLLDFSPVQIERILPLGRDKVLELVKDGKLSPSMTVREMKDVVKAHKPPKGDAETTFTDVQEEPTEHSEEPVQPVETSEEPTQVTLDDITEEPVKAGIRPSEFDQLSTDWLVAELRARGFKVYKAQGVEMLYEWGTETKEELPEDTEN